MGETVVVDLNKIVGSTSVTGSDGALTYAGWVSGTNGDGGLKITVTNKEAFTTGSKTITLNISQTVNNGYKFVIPVELNVAPQYATCGTKQYYTKTHFCDSRVGNNIIYKKVTIGGVTWMAENLRYASSTGSYCYGGTAGNCTTYGRLYTWAAFVGKSETECGYGYTCSLGEGNIQGVCPTGWHVPSKKEWEKLVSDVASSSTVAAKNLKSKSYWTSGAGSDSYEFTALPAGSRDPQGDFGDLGSRTQFWTVTVQNNNFAYSVTITAASDAVYINTDWNKKRAFSVRCIKD